MKNDKETLGRGWGDMRPGDQVTDIAEISVGDILLSYSGQFNSKNLIHIRGKRKYGELVYLGGVYGDPLEPKKRASHDDFSISDLEISSPDNQYYKPLNV